MGALRTCFAAGVVTACELRSGSLRRLLGGMLVAFPGVVFGAALSAPRVNPVAFGQPPAPAASGRPEAVEFRRVDGEERVIVKLGDHAQIGQRRPRGRFIADFTPPVLSSGRNHRLDVADIVAQITVVGMPALRTDFPIVRAVESDRDAVRLTLDFKDAPVRTVLQRIVEVADVNLVASDSVQGTMSLRLINVPWTRALDIVLVTQELDQRRDGNVIWVAPAAELAEAECGCDCGCCVPVSSLEALVTEYLQINHVKARDIAASIMAATEQARALGSIDDQGKGSGATGALSPRGSATYDERTNTLLINDTADRIKEIFALVALLDRETK